MRATAEGDEADEEDADDGRLRPDGEGVPQEAVEQLQGDGKVGEGDDEVEDQHAGPR